MFLELSGDFSVVKMTHGWYSSYDSLISKVCPDYESGLDMIVRGIKGNPKRILELGIGTGNLTARIAEAFPKADITGIDGDKTMLEAAVKKLQPYKNVKVADANIVEYDVNGFDAIVSSLVLHMLPNVERIKLLNRVYQPGAGQVIVFDRMKGEIEEQENAFLDYFTKQLQGKGIGDETIKQLVRESRRNNPMRLSEHRRICEANNFIFEILHQNLNHGFMAYRGLENV